MPLIADQKVEALNRLTRAVHRGLPDWNEDYDADFDGIRLKPNKVHHVALQMLSRDVEVQCEAHNLLRIIIEEKTLLDQK